MSFDLRIAVKIEGLEKYVTIDRPAYDDPTYNLSKMFRECMNWDFEQGTYYNCADIIEHIDEGIYELRYNAKKYEQYNPENGWGNIDDALDSLKSLRRCIRDNQEYIPIEHLYMAW